MPELPEVETVVRQLSAAVTKRRISSVTVYDRKLDAAADRRLVGRTITRVFRSGKQIVFELTTKSARSPVFLVVHLRMTGRLLFRASRGKVHGQVKTVYLAKTGPEHLRFSLKLNGGELLFFDPRRFGTVSVFNTLDDFAPRGLDPLTTQFTKQVLAELCRGSSQNAKAFLLRQDRITGIGNIYACEILFRTGIHPEKPVSALKALEIKQLHQVICSVLRDAIKNCGTTFSDFEDLHGDMGGYARFLRVYSREGQPCRSCQMPIVRITQQQRSTFYCPRCQR